MWFIVCSSKLEHFHDLICANLCSFLMKGVQGVTFFFSFFFSFFFGKQLEMYIVIWSYIGRIICMSKRFIIKTGNHFSP